MHAPRHVPLICPPAQAVSVLFAHAAEEALRPIGYIEKEWALDAFARYIHPPAPLARTRTLPFPMTSFCLTTLPLFQGVPGDDRAAGGHVVRGRAPALFLSRT